MRRSLLLLGLTIPALGAGELPAQGGRGAADARLAALPPAAAASVRARVAEMRTLGLPAEAVVLRALELAAKGAAPAALVRRIDDFTVRLTVADHMLRLGGRAGGADEIVAAADALGSGLEPGQLRLLALDAPPAEPLTTALIAVTALLDRGIGPADALGAVAARLAAPGRLPRAATAAAAATDGVAAASPPLVPTAGGKNRRKGHGRLPTPPNVPII